MIDLSALGMADIIRLQSSLQQELTRRFERPMTMAFSDIVGSTPYFERFGDAAGRQLQQLHLDLLHKCLPGHEGRIVDTAGDGAFLSFPSANAAMAALIAFEQNISRENATRARDHQLQVRVGLHHGPVLTDGNVVSGDAVNLCARVASSARSGEIRLTRELFQELALMHRLNCRPLEAQELKGVSRQVDLLALEWRDHSVFPKRVRFEETAEELELPLQDIITFGRLRDHEGTLANDVVLTTADPALLRQISRWQFELRRFPDGYRLRSVSDALTEVDGVPVPKGTDVSVRPGARIRVARLLTLVLVSPQRVLAEDNAATKLVG
jgi:class 3 adenylate cyclase